MSIETLQKNILLPDGSYMPKVGQGTWQMGEDDNRYQAEIAGIRHGIEMGMRLIDTAEMYADGKAENVVGNAIKPFNREDIFVVDKVYPQNANKRHIYSSLEKSLKLLCSDYVDMYLLHWREDADLSEMVYCMEDLKDKGKIRRWGVSNFDVEDMEELWGVKDGNKCCVNQVLYNLGSRGIEYDLMKWQEEKKVPFIGYGPVGQAGAMTTQEGVSKAMLMSDSNVAEVAERRNISRVQLLLAFVLRFDNMAAIPKAVSYKHIEENAAAADIVLAEEDLKQLSRSFPEPTRRVNMEKY